MFGWNRIGRFIVQICKTWGARLTGGFFIALFTSWQITGHSNWCIAVACGCDSEHRPLIPALLSGDATRLYTADWLGRHVSADLSSKP